MCGAEQKADLITVALNRFIMSPNLTCVCCIAGKSGGVNQMSETAQ